MTAKFLRIIRLDDSDTRVYDPCAAGGEWAIPGSFHFWDLDPDTLDAKTRQAFAHGFLGTDSFGWGSLVTVSEISPAELDDVIQRLAAHLVARFGAPDLATALPAAREEVAFAQSLCDHPLNTLISIERRWDDEQISEQFKTLKSPSGAEHDELRLWDIDSYDANG